MQNWPRIRSAATVLPCTGRAGPARDASFPGKAARLGLPALLAAWGLAQAVLIYVWAPWIKGSFLFHALHAAGTAAAILVPARAGRALQAPRWTVQAVLLGGFAAAVALARVAMQSFSNSGDEYGFSYLADTLLRGRLWNAPLPDDPWGIFETVWITDRDGKRVSQYTPGWPAVLAGFKLASVPDLANPVLGLLASVFLWLSLRRLPVPPWACAWPRRVMFAEWRATNKREPSMEKTDHPPATDVAVESGPGSRTIPRTPQPPLFTRVHGRSLEAAFGFSTL